MHELDGLYFITSVSFSKTNRALYNPLLHDQDGVSQLKYGHMLYIVVVPYSYLFLLSVFIFHLLCE